jgi:hypothetical protein
MTHHFTKSIVEEAALAWLESLGYTILYGPTIAPGEADAEREHSGDPGRRSRRWLAATHLGRPSLQLATGSLALPLHQVG